MLTQCIYCSSGDLREIESYRALHRITSDCKPWGDSGKFAVCSACGMPQTVTDSQWNAEIEKIYSSYSIYYQSGGQEQSVFDPQTGQPSLRSECIIRRLLSNVTLSLEGSLLDYGCGNGGFLRAFQRSVSGWNLYGCEWNDKHHEQLSAIPGFVKLYSSPDMVIREAYDVVSLIHCLEHLPQPCDMLSRLRRLVKEDGLLLIQVPDCSINPFLLLLADHCSHFSVETLSALIRAAGFEILVATNQWVPKEITIVARPTAKPYPFTSVGFEHAQLLEHHLAWLSEVSAQARKESEEKKLGIFGTAIAGTWLWKELEGRAAFFVDEDPNRQGLQHYGLPILSPHKVPPESSVYLALPPLISLSVQKRLHGVITNLIVPHQLN